MKVPKGHKVPKASDSDESDIQANLGRAVKAQRRRLGVTQEELAWRANLHRTYIADIERGGRNVTLSSIISLARALEVSVATLLSQPGDAQPSSAAGEILLVEDDRLDAELTLHAFNRAKFRNPITVIRDGQGAIDYLFDPKRPEARPYPLLILLDLNLPRVPGIEILRRIKSDDRTRKIPVIVLTGSSEDSIILECSLLGADQYLVKPVEFEKLSRVSPRFDLHWTLSSPVGSLTAAAPAEPQSG